MQKNIESPPVTNRPERGSPIEVLGAFFKLGLTSFGGPVAHLGYFRSEFVERRQWLDDKSYSDLVAFCHRPLRSFCLRLAWPTGPGWPSPASFMD